MPDVDRHSPAGRPVAAAPGLCVIRPIALATIWNLQGDPRRAVFADFVGAQLGYELPTLANTATVGPGGTALWIGPRSWLLLGDTEQPPAALHAHREALNAAGGALFDLSAARGAIQVGGVSAADLLASFCPLDLHPGVFAPGACAQSLFGHLNALYYANAESEFTIFVARSLYRDAWQALCEAGRRHGFTIGEAARFTTTRAPASEGPGPDSRPGR